MNVKPLSYTLLSLFLCLLGCSETHKKSVQSEPCAIVNLAAVMRDYAGMDSVARARVTDSCSTELKAFVKTLSEDSMSDVLLEAWSTSAPVAVFTPAADSIYPSLEGVERALGYTLAAAREYGIELPSRRYAAVVYGRPESILFVDSVMLIALNHYLGADYDGYSHWPLYRRLAKTPQALPYDMAEALIATAYPYSAPEADNTLLSNMLYQGALAYAKLHTVEDATVAGVLGYDEATMRQLNDAEDDMWRELVARKLLYDTSSRTKERFIAPTPVLRIDGLEWPARAGRYIGYRIVEAYMSRHPETGIDYLLSPEFYLSADVLREADYLG